MLRKNWWQLTVLYSIVWYAAECTLNDLLLEKGAPPYDETCLDLMQAGSAILSEQKDSNINQSILYYYRSRTFLLINLSS
jgi:hypothetical protein